MSTFLGSQVCGVTITDSGMSLINNSTNVLTFSNANTNADFGGYSLTNLGAMKADLSMGTFKITNVVNPTSA
jgi:hypothetical protein